MSGRSGRRAGAARQVWVVMRREYVERVMTKGFIIATVAIPILMIGMIGLNIFLAVRAELSDRELALVDLTGDLGEEVADRLGALGYAFEIAPAEDTAALDQRVLDEDLEGYLVLDDATLAEGVFSYRGIDAPGSTRAALFEGTVTDVALEHLLSTTNAGDAVRALIEGGRLEYRSLTDAEDPEAADAARVTNIATGLGGSIVLYMSMLLYGAFVLRSVLDEKRNRVVEVVISSVTPGRLLLGKVLGVGSMGLTQLGIWTGSASLILLVAAPMLTARIPGADLGAMGEFLPGPGVLALFLAFFLLGFFLYAALFAAVGAMCATEEEAGQAQLPVVMLLVVPFMMQVASVGGGMRWMDWAALFPFFSPVMMFPRAAAGAVPWWMPATSLVLMAAAVVGTAWVAGRIYRVGILMQGKRPTMRELARWVREA